MSATCPPSAQEANSGVESLNQLIESQHSNLYKRREFDSSDTIIYTIACLFAALPVTVVIHAEMDKYWFPDIFVIAIVLSLILHLAIWLINKPHNKIVDDVIQNSNLVVLEKPRWIKNIGFVNKLHPADLNKGTEIEIATQEVAVNGIYFLHNRKCFKHENKQGINHDVEIIPGDGLNVDRYIDSVSYYYYQIANFEIQSKELELKNMDYSPAFDTSINYNIIFQVTKFDEDMIHGKCLKVFLPDKVAHTYPEKWVGHTPDTSQPMNNNHQKAAIA